MKMRARTASGTGLKGLTIAVIIEKFFRDINRFPVEPDGLNWTQSQIRAVAEHISATGDCLWHAQSIVSNTQCYCARCESHGDMSNSLSQSTPFGA
jgi:hypothetical protein